MKNTILQLFAACLLGVFIGSPNVWGQGTIAANNINGSGNPLATNFGLFFETGGTPYSAPINVTILGGPDANNLTPIVTLSGPNALVAVAPGGRYMDPSAGIYIIPGVASGQLATLQVLAWKGNAATFYEANPGEDWFYAYGGNYFINPTLFTFTNPTGVAQPASLDGMPAMWRMLVVPEPAPTWLLLLGLPWFFFYRRHNK